jgi:hypothetical protein
MRHHQQAHEDLGRRRVAPVHGGEWGAPRPVAADLGGEQVVLQQAIELGEDGSGLVGQFGHAGDHVFGRGAVDEQVAATSTTA